jgi:hypothetical protein
VIPKHPMGLRACPSNALAVTIVALVISCRSSRSPAGASSLGWDVGIAPRRAARRLTRRKHVRRRKAVECLRRAIHGPSPQAIGTDCNSYRVELMDQGELKADEGMCHLPPCSDALPRDVQFGDVCDYP